MYDTYIDVMMLREEYADNTMSTIAAGHRRGVTLAAALALRCRRVLPPPLPLPPSRSPPERGLQKVWKSVLPLPLPLPKE